MTWSARPSMPAGHKVTATDWDAVLDQIDSLTSQAWTSYTPSWTSSGTAPALGNGTLTGRYRLVNGSNMIEVRVSFTAGSTSTYGTGSWRFSVPSGKTAAAAAIIETTGTVWMLDSGTANKAGICLINTGGNELIPITSANDVSATTPHTWATGDRLSCTIRYDLA